MAHHVEHALLAVGVLVSVLLNGCGSKVATTTTDAPWPWPTTDAPSGGPSTGPSEGPSTGPVCEQLPDTTCVGEDLAFRQYPSPDPDDCCKLCSNVPLCKAWTFEHADEGSRCLLKRGCPRRQPSSAHTSGRSGHLAQCTQFPGMDCQGRDMGQGEEVDSPEDCCDLCDRTENCTAFSFRTPDFHNNRSWCYLKTGCTAKKANANVTSGTNGRMPPSQCPLLTSERCVGPELLNTSAPNPAACCDLCTLTQGCAAFRWESDVIDPQCTLLTACLETDAHEGSVSGTWGYPSQCSVALHNTGCGGDDLGGAYANNYDGCCNLCGETPGCNAFTFNEQDYHPEGQWCYLKASCDANNRTSSNVSTSGFLPKCWSKWGVRCKDASLAGKHLATQDECCDLCSKTKACTAWTHKPFGDESHSAAWCYLFSNCSKTEECGETQCTTGFYRGYDPDLPSFSSIFDAPAFIA